MGDPLQTTVKRPASRRGPAPAPTARLCVVYPPALVGAHALGDAAVVLGRDPEGAGLVLADETVSRRHLRIEWMNGPGLHFATDLGSRNGSNVDGVALAAEPRPLVDGAVVRAGDVLLVYELTEERVTEDGPVDREAVPGEAMAMVALRARLARAAGDPAPVLLVGESGTGKEHIAAELHRLSGRKGRLVAVNCAALSRELAESQLFGHQKGAFTGATEAHPGYFRAAHGGTIFLDEIGELSLELQPKLLRAIQQGEVQAVGSAQPGQVDARVVAATNRDLAQASGAGQFRADLYARLALWELRVPPLRERRRDLFPWIERLHRRWRTQRPGEAGQPLAFEPDAAQALLRAPWPLNLRGLERLIHELAVPGAQAPIAPSRLPAWVAGTAPARATSPEPPRAPVPSREVFLAAYQELGGSVRALARHFGRDRRQIYRWIESHGLGAPPDDR
jgi:DNA-binding NtrC family response regulator